MSPQIIYVALDDTPLPQLEKNRIAIVAKGKKFPKLCQEIYENIVQIPKTIPDIDLSKWDEIEF